MSEFEEPFSTEINPEDLPGLDERWAELRYDPRLVNTGMPSAPSSLLPETGGAEDAAFLGRLLERIRAIFRPAPEEPALPEPPVNLITAEAPNRYGMNDAWRDPDVMKRYQEILPDYAEEYQAQFPDEGRYPFRVAPLPETGLPRYVTGFLADAVEDVTDPAAVRQRADEWLEKNAALVATDRTRALGDGLRYVDQVRFGSAVAGGARGLEPTIAREPTIAQARYQQYANNLPIYGGAMSLTLTRASQHLSITNSFFPIPDEKKASLQPLTGEAKKTSQQRAVAEAKRLLAADGEFTGPDAVALLLHLLAPAAATNRWNEPEDLLAAKFFAELEHAKDEGVVNPERIGELARYAEHAPWERLRVIWEIRRELGIPEWKDAAQVKVAPYRGSDLIILPHNRDYHLAWRLHITPPGSYSTWQVFVDAHSGVVLGEAESLAAHLRHVASSRSLEAGEPDVDNPNLTADVLENQIAAFFQLQPHQLSVIPLRQILNAHPNRARETINIAVHGLRCFDYFVNRCGVDRERLRPDTSPETPNSADLLTLVVGHGGDHLAIRFNPELATVVFQSDPGGGIIDGSRRIHQPSLDPEVVYHELVHACMWRLSPDSFELPQQRVPFAKALLEGYAIYFARSIAENHAEIAAANLPDDDSHLWARAAYRKTDVIDTMDVGWGQDWSLFRQQISCAGEDFLPWPNLYPSKSVTDLDVYRIGMIWARALWEIRRILGVDITDRTALVTFPALVGWAISFETAADNFVDSLRRDTASVNDAQIAAVIDVFNRRNISAGRSVRAVAETVAANGAVTCYAGGPGFLRRARDDGSWQTVPLPEFTETAQGITALAANGPHLYAATEDKVWHFDGAIWTEIAGWPADQLPLSMHHTGRSLWIGSSSNLQEFTPGAQPHSGTWNVHEVAQGGEPSVLSVGEFSVTENGVEHPGISVLTLDVEEALARFAGEQELRWRSLGDRDADNAYIGWPLCVTGVGDAIYLGTLNTGLWKKTMRFRDDRLRDPGHWQPAATDGFPSCAAVLSLTSHDGVLYAGTGAGLFMMNDSAASVWQPVSVPIAGAPAEQPMVRSLSVTNNHLLVGTVHHGVWMRSGNGIWSNHPISM